MIKNRAVFCENSDCSFALWKDNHFFRTKKKTLTREIAEGLLKDGRVFVKELYSEKNNSYYDAFVVLDDTGGKYVNFKIDFPPRKVKKGGRK